MKNETLKAVWYLNECNRGGLKLEESSKWARQIREREEEGEEEQFWKDEEPVFEEFYSSVM